MDLICILDFEATCWEENGDHEIIEFPSVILKKHILKWVLVNQKMVLL
jgi:hypothetical protein